jgi:hypothetical protein
LIHGGGRKNDHGGITGEDEQHEVSRQSPPTHLGHTDVAVDSWTGKVLVRSASYGYIGKQPTPYKSINEATKPNHRCLAPISLSSQLP